MGTLHEKMQKNEGFHWRWEATMRSCLYRVKDLNPPLNKAMQHQVGKGNGKIGEIPKTS